MSLEVTIYESLVLEITNYRIPMLELGKGMEIYISY